MKIENIKFKAKSLDNNGGWVVGSLIRSTTGIKERAYIVDDFNSMSDYSVIGVDPSTICQFTGLTDCKGKEIWEHDLLQSQETKAIYEVVWNDGGFIISDYVVGVDTMKFLCSALRMRRIKVVGNKYDKEDKV